MSFVSNLRTFGAVAGILGMCMTMTEAATIPPGGSLLSDLIAGTTTVTSGDKTITDVSYIAVGPDMPTASQIVVAPIMDMHGNFGFRFVGPFEDVDDGFSSDAFLEYTVNVIAPNLQIAGVNLMGNPSVMGANGTASITETFLPQVTTVKLEIADREPGNFSGMDSTVLAGGYSSLTVQKDIQLRAGTGSSATLSFFDQTFNQVEGPFNPVPEPTTFGLLTLASLGLLVCRRRRS